MTDTLVEELAEPEEPSEEFRSIWTDLRGVAFEQGWMAVNGVNVRYLRAGSPDSPKLLMLAGTGGHAETFVANLGALGQHHDCWAIDVPGCGYSDKADMPYDAIHLADFFKSWADQIGAATISVVGVSVGSWTALQMALRHPDLVEKLILVSPAGGPQPDPEDSWHWLWEAPDLREALASEGQARLEIVEKPSFELAEKILAGLIPDRRRLPDDMIAARLDVNRQPGVAEKVDEINWWTQYVPRHENGLSRDQLRSIQQPVLGVCELEDRMLPIVQAMFTCLPNSRLVRVSGVGHWPHYETPSKFNDWALAHLKGG